MDAQSFKETFLPCQGRLYRAALRLTEDREEAADLVQETYLKLWECRHKLPPMENTEAYAVRTLCNLHLSLRRASRPEAADTAVEGLPLADPSTPALILERTEEGERMRQLMSLLGEPQQTVVRMRDVEGCEIGEIEQATGLKGARLRMTLSRGRRKLKELFLKNRNL